jgi:serine/threonine-protein kinase
MIGRTISHYQVTEKLGAGGMGEIFKARDPRLNRTVAIKVLAGSAMADPERRRRFIQEAQAASSLNHPNIITIHDILSDEDNEYMVMEFVAGKTLADLIPGDGIGVEKTLRYGVQISDALAAAHAAGIVHRDLKPGNVMVTESGLVKILDFGLAKVSLVASLTEETQTLGTPMTVEGSILGTVSYMSPEQAQGSKVDARSDIFAFGSLMYEMVTGHKAFHGTSALATLTAILRDQPAPVRDGAPDCPPELEEIIGRSLRKAPGDRWQSMQEVHGLLATLRQKFESGILYGAKLPPPAKGLTRNFKLGLISFLVIFGIGGWLVTLRRAQRTPAAPIVVVTPPPAVPTTVEPPVPGAIPPVPGANDKPSPLGEPPKPQTAGNSAAAKSDGPLTNQSIIDLTAAKVPEAVILGQIRASKTRFDLSNAGIIQLSRGGVTPAVIEAMRRPASAAPTVAAVEPVPSPVAAPPSLAPAAEPSATTPAPRATQQVPVLGGVAFEIVLTQEVPVDPVPGTLLRFRASKDVLAGGAVVIAKGAAVTGHVLEPGKKNLIIVKRAGKPMFSLSDVAAVDGTRLKVKASPGRSGEKNEHHIEPPGHKSKDSLAPAGTAYQAFFDGDQTVAVKK